MTDFRDIAAEHLRAGVGLRERVLAECMDDLLAAVDVVAGAMRSGGKLLICGNGGSAADSQHLAAEFVCSLGADRLRRGLPAIALTTDASAITAWANDFGFDGIFARQVEALGRPGDVLLGISTSGGSRNVLLAMEQARSSQMKAIALLGGREEPPMAELADVSIAVPSIDTQLIQEAHLALEHLLCDGVERALAG